MNNEYDLKLKRFPKPSVNMKAVVEQGYYPSEYIKLFNKDIDLPYKQNYRVTYQLPDNLYGIHNGINYGPDEVIYFDTQEKMDNYFKKYEPKAKITDKKLVDEWHHINRSGKSKLVDIKKILEQGLKIDASTANKFFKMPLLNMPIDIQTMLLLQGITPYNKEEGHKYLQNNYNNFNPIIQHIIDNPNRV